MKEIQVNTVSTPVFNKGDCCIANESFVHADRILDFHVMIYVRKGCIYVTEESDGIETDYEIHEGELLFLKAGIIIMGKGVSQRNFLVLCTFSASRNEGTSNL